MMRKIRQKVWFLLILIMFLSFSNSSHPQTRLPDVHFEATPAEVVDAMLKMAGVTKEDVVYDLGCGDGRFVITAAKKFGARGVGVDIDPVRIRESNENARKAGVNGRVKFTAGDLFTIDFREATVVTLYLLNEMNLQLRPKLLHELKPGTRIVSHSFDMADWEPDNIGRVKERTFYYWVVPANISGTWRLSLHSSLIAGWKNELFLDQEFQEISGKISIQGWQMRLREPRLSGDQLRFRLRYNSEGQDVAMRFNGRVHGDTIKGSVEIEGGPSAGRHEWVAERIKN